MTDYTRKSPVFLATHNRSSGKLTRQCRDSLRQRTNLLEPRQDRRASQQALPPHLSIRGDMFRRASLSEVWGVAGDAIVASGAVMTSVYTCQCSSAHRGAAGHAPSSWAGTCRVILMRKIRHRDRTRQDTLNNYLRCCTLFTVPRRERILQLSLALVRAHRAHGYVRFVRLNERKDLSLIVRAIRELAEAQRALYQGSFERGAVGRRESSRFRSFTVKGPHNRQNNHALQSEARREYISITAPASRPPRRTGTTYGCHGNIHATRLESRNA